MGSTLLEKAYKMYEMDVRDHLNQSERLNVIFDESGDVQGNRILNVSVQVDSRHVFYWKNISLSSQTMSAEALLACLLPEFENMTNGDLNRISSFSVDTCNASRAIFKLTQLEPRLKHLFIVLCDSHGLNLLVGDILQLPRWKPAIKKAANILTCFRTSNKQLARLRDHQRVTMADNEAKALVLA